MAEMKFADLVSSAEGTGDVTGSVNRQKGEKAQYIFDVG
jgi:hypothetical protein